MSECFPACILISICAWPVSFCCHFRSHQPCAEQRESFARCQKAEKSLSVNRAANPLPQQMRNTQEPSLAADKTAADTDATWVKSSRNEKNDFPFILATVLSPKRQMAWLSAPACYILKAFAVFYVLWLAFFFVNKLNDTLWMICQWYLKCTDAVILATVYKMRERNWSLFLKEKKSLKIATGGWSDSINHLGLSVWNLIKPNVPSLLCLPQSCLAGCYCSVSLCPTITQP